MSTTTMEEEARMPNASELERQRQEEREEYARSEKWRQAVGAEPVRRGLRQIAAELEAAEKRQQAAFLEYNEARLEAETLKSELMKEARNV
jgi:hypothetical protein